MTMSRPSALIALLCALAFAGLAALDAARNALTELNPALAARLPGSEGAKVNLISLSLGQPARMPPKDEVFAIARARLHDEPLDPGALNIMAYAMDPTGRSGAGTRYADLATQVSKRMTFSQLAMTAISLKQGDVPGTIGRFDAVLRARPEASSLFFPYLKQALAQPDIRQAIANLAAQDSPWVMTFLASASNDAKFTGLAADAMLRAGRDVPVNDRLVYAGPMLTRAFDSGHYAEARRLVSLVPGGNDQLFASPALTQRSLDPKYGQAAWQLTSTSTGSASAVGAGSGQPPALSLYATGGSHDVLAAKHLLLRPGRYVLNQRIETGATADAETSAVWRLTCVGGPELWQSGNLLARTVSKRLGPFAVPAGCPAQRLELAADVAFGHPSIELTLRAIALEPVGGSEQ
jgi:hypothetical protein